MPVMFIKPGSAPSGPFDPIVRPIECANLDYEAELAIVVGKGGRRISADRAAEHIAGYMITNDATARDLGEGESKMLNLAPLFQVMRLKGWDTFLPTGPWSVTGDEVGNYEDIRIQTWVNGEPRQDGAQARRHRSHRDDWTRPDGYARACGAGCVRIRRCPGLISDQDGQCG